MDWLRKEVSWFKAFILILGLYVIGQICSTLILSFFPQVLSNVPVRKGTWDIKGTIIIYIFVGAFLEEVVFRFIPLGFAVGMIKKDWAIMFALLFSSAIFGYLHGNAYNIALQGVIGVILSIAFLKCGGMQKRYWRGLFFCTLLHFMHNGLIAVSLYNQGVNKF